jgi:hypothetical protein
MTDYDVLCVGNAIVDIIARCDDDFLVDNHIIKGAMNLIDADRAKLLYERMGPAIEASGGSAGNTAAGLASFGGARPSSARSPRTVSAKSTPTTCAPRAWPSTPARLTRSRRPPGP